VYAHSEHDSPLLSDVIPGPEGTTPPRVEIPAAEVGAPDLPMLAKSSERSLLAANRSPATTHTDLTSVRRFDAFLPDRRMPRRLAPGPGLAEP
jgi:hypothetical protein